MGRKSRLKIDRPAPPPAPARAAVAERAGAREWVVVAALVVLTFAVFGQVATHTFLNYDDGQFVYENEHVRHGLTGSSIAWALTSAEIGYYPLTWLSHELDVQLWGLSAGTHLLMNVTLHAITTCLLFFALQGLFGRDVARSRGRENQDTSRPRDPATPPAAFVAALFAIHPMHVESVAWVSERKDTLSTLFAVIALLLYTRDPRRKLGVAVALALSLGAKQMYITLPFVFLLLDYWPLDRLRDLDEFRQRVIEKIPLFVLAAAGGVIAVIGQRNLRAVQSTAVNPLGERFANAAVAYVRYLGKLVAPVNLATPYPLALVPFAQAAGATLLLGAITAAVIVLRKRAPYLPVGWFWFLGTLVPVIGIVSLGSQSMADRYSYFSYIGLFIAIALAIPRRALVPAGAVVVAILAAIAFHQVGYWKDSETLFTHAIAVTTPNPVAEYSLGQTLQMTKPDVAIPHLRKAIDLTASAKNNPEWYAQAHVGLGTALLMKARNETSVATRTQWINDALQHYRQALVIDPKAEHAQNNIAVANQMLGLTPAPAPDPRIAYNAAIDGGLALLREGKSDGAIVEFRKAVALQPQSPAAHVYLAIGLLNAHRGRDAAAELRAAKAIDVVRANEYAIRALRVPIDEAIARAEGQ